MALSKATEIPKIEVVYDWNVQVATDTVIKEDGVELSRSRHRHVLTPFQSNYDDTTKEPSVLPSQFPNLLVNSLTL